MQCLGKFLHHKYICYFFFVFCVAPNTTENCTNGNLRLKGSENHYEGRIEICLNGSWGSICPYNWDNNDAAVVCKQLNFSAIGKLGDIFV